MLLQLTEIVPVKGVAVVENLFAESSTNQQSEVNNLMNSCCLLHVDTVLICGFILRCCAACYSWCIESCMTVDTRLICSVCVES